MTSAHENVTKVVFCGCLALLLLAPSCGVDMPVDTRATDEATIRESDAQWSKTAGARDLEGTLSYYTDDAALLAPNAPIATGKAALRAAWAPMVAPDSTVSWEATKVDVARSSDLAYSMGTYQLEMKGPDGKPIKDRGKFVEVWKKQADHKWRVVTDMFNSDLPLAADSAATKK